MHAQSIGSAISACNALVVRVVELRVVELLEADAHRGRHGEGLSFYNR